MDAKTEVDLMPFCDADHNSRYALQTPFVQGGVRYATDGKIMATLPAVGEPDTVREDGGRLPRGCDSIMLGYGDIAEGDWQAMPPMKSDCKKCDGSGNATCEYCFGDMIHECKCGHSHTCENCNEGNVTCNCYVMFGERQVASWLTQKMRTLPGVQWSAAGREVTDRIFFRFDHGGRGCVMPLDPRHA
jgi:hypothetical protein